MDITQMRYFMGVCEAGSMSAAAQKLHLSQQGLSLSLRRLEEELGCALFVRRPNGVELTEAGRLFFCEATEILKHVDRIQNFFSQRTYKDGKFLVHCSVADSLLPRLPAKLQQLLITGDEEYNVLLSEGYSSECVERLNTDDSVFAIVYGDWDKSKYDVTLLDYVEQVFIVNREHPWAVKDSISLKELDGVPLCVSDERSKPRQELKKMFDDAGAKLNVSFTCNRPRVTLDLVSNNPALIARTIADEIKPQDLEKIKVLQLEDMPFIIKVNLLSKKNRKLNIQERYFKRLVLDSYKNAV